MTVLSDFVNGIVSLPEFIPYVFQVMSLLLEMHKNEIPSSYMALFPHLLQPVLWERTGNIPPLVRLLQAYLERGASTIASAAADKIVSAWGRVGVWAWGHGHLSFQTVRSSSKQLGCAQFGAYIQRQTNTVNVDFWVLFYYMDKMNSRLLVFLSAKMKNFCKQVNFHSFPVLFASLCV